MESSCFLYLSENVETKMDLPEIKTQNHPVYVTFSSGNINKMIITDDRKTCSMFSLLYSTKQKNGFFFRLETRIGPLPFCRNVCAHVINSHPWDV